MKGDKARCWSNIGVENFIDGVKACNARNASLGSIVLIYSLFRSDKKGHVNKRGVQSLMSYCEIL